MGWAEEMGYDAFDEDDFKRGAKSCSRCGADDLAFEKVDGRWRLVDMNGNPHHCDRVKVAQADFAVPVAENHANKRGRPMTTQTVPNRLPSIEDIRFNVERIYDHNAEARISPWHVREALRMIVDRLEAIEKQNGDDHA